MEDVQSGPALVAVPIDSVGVKGLRIPLVVRERGPNGCGVQHTVAEVDLGVELPAAFKGTHMSRFVEALEGWSDNLDYASMKNLLEDVKTRLQARRASILIRFPYFIRKAAPVSGITSLMRYECTLSGELDEAGLRVVLGVVVPVMTVCPCSKAISREGAHSQRAEVRMTVEMEGFRWIEEFVELAERAGSSPVYSLLKRADEKHVTEDAFSRPAFVEDVVRAVAEDLLQFPDVAWFRVDVESFESIHAHNAFARIERRRSEPCTAAPTSS